MSNINLFPELDNEEGQDPEYNNGHTDYKQEEEELIVFGYSCKLFRDDFSAKAIDRGQSLIPWNGDENVMIDRYDCRGHLSDLTLWDSDLLRKKQTNNEGNLLSEDEQRIEEECDQERYLELYKDIEKETLQQEEISKRLDADRNAYNQVGFSYDDSSKSKETSNKITEEAPQTLDDDEYEPFYPSEKLQIPYGMDIPESIKLNAVIEKTAGFVSTSGVQMEIVLKTKQANNPQFDFLKYDHYLNPYYRHLIIMIKSGKYRPNVDNNSNTNTQKKKTNKNGIDQSSSHDEDEAGDSYLHPLLRGGTNTDNTISMKKSDETLRTPSIPMNIHNTAYGQLIKKYEHLRQREKVAKENEEETMSPKPEEIKNEESSPRSETFSSTNVIPPPPDVKPIIDKLAEYVARNGSTFEQSIRTKDDARFGFLERDHIHHNYYQLKVQLCTQEILRSKLEENHRHINNDEQHVHGKGIKLVLKTNIEESLTPTSCQEFNSDGDSNSMQQNEQNDSGEFIGPRPPSPEFLEKMRKQEQRRDRVNDFVRDKIARDKQEERKRKAEMLVQQLKSKTNESPLTTDVPESTTTPVSTINPILVEKLLNVKNERPSSSSIVTSPHHNHRSKHSRSPSKSRNQSKYYRRSRSKSNHRRRRRRSSHKRSRTRSKSRSHHRSKKPKTSKSSKSSRDHRRHRHRRRHSSASASNSSSTSRSSRSTSSSSSHDTKKKKKTTHNNDEHQQDQRKKNSQSSKWDQREPTKLKTETSSMETSTTVPSLSMNTEVALSNSTSS